MKPHTAYDQTVDLQRRASDPDVSAWVSANAGAGKTRVLTDRVLRLMLSGIKPHRLLCLTFTKAAAAEMSIRVFDTLGHWVTLDDAALTKALFELEGKPPGSASLRKARRLFASAIETPGGLKIDTIHAFCEKLLQLVPLEAGVPARFTVLDETAARKLMEEALHSALARASEEDSSSLSNALKKISIETSFDQMHDLLVTLVKDTEFWERFEDQGFEGITQKWRKALKLKEDDQEGLIYKRVLTEAPGTELLEANPRLLQHGNRASKRATLIEEVFGQHDFKKDDLKTRAEIYLHSYLTKEGQPLSQSYLFTKAVTADIQDLLLREQDRILPLYETLKACLILDKTQALITFAHDVRRSLQSLKRRKGALDFDDLIDKTLNLLRRGEGEAAWVLYKLDRGIDHVLIDEAQDTNPHQWEIIKRITQDFTSGLGAREGKPRTLFAVGDPKQSIYSFQGAQPQELESSKRYFARAHTQTDLGWEDVRLTLSFRSGPAVLSAVDAIFADPAHFKGLSFEDQVIGTVHESMRPNAPGCVELWPVEEPDPKIRRNFWDPPENIRDDAPPAIRTARKVAMAIRHGIEYGRFHPRDVLVLCRKRDAGFEAVIRSLKEEGVAVAGADRLDISIHIAIRDLIAAAQSALLPQDDLVLASALKSPLVGLNDEELMSFCADREQSETLLQAIQRHADGGNEAARQSRQAHDLWTSLSREHNPFGFFASLLGPHQGRAKLIGRLGQEAGDAIDSFLCLAHDSELSQAPSLSAFLTRFLSAPHELKRDSDATRDEVRVMTIHGAKGLEAPVVILLDGGHVGGKARTLFKVEQDGIFLPLWSASKDRGCAACLEVRRVIEERETEEHHRLLYVALTRARDHLIIAPYRGQKKLKEGAWSQMIERSLSAGRYPLQTRQLSYGEVRIWEHASHSAEASEKVLKPTPVHKEPAWLRSPAIPEPEPLPPLRPSSALNAADRPFKPAFVTAQGENLPSRRRGILIHKLLERLPSLTPDRRKSCAESYLKAQAGHLSKSEREEIIHAVCTTLNLPELSPLFGPDSRAEVDIAGEVLQGGQSVPVLGRIDRFAKVGDTIWLADFKSGTRQSGARLTQLALYRALLQQITPDTLIRTFLIWTSGPNVEEIEACQLDEAMFASGKDDVSISAGRRY
jgi:ATP-dependent helicase/nuclease subunit A